MRFVTLEASTAALFCAVVAAATSTCIAQDTRAARPAQVSLGFNLTISAAEAESTSQGRLVPAESTRRAFYQLIAAECDILLATIASSCQLSNASVNIAEQRHNQPSPYVQINGSGNFAITLKPKT